MSIKKFRIPINLIINNLLSQSSTMPPLSIRSNERKGEFLHSLAIFKLWNYASSVGLWTLCPPLFNKNDEEED